MSEIIYKICKKADWADAKIKGFYSGSVHDKRDGFIHFSTATQLPATLAKHYAGETDLVLIGVSTKQFTHTLKYEPARDGDLFPHLYDNLQMQQCLWEIELVLDENGIHKLPKEVC